MADLTTETGMKSYLDSSRFKFCQKVSKIERLPEGNVGWVYRVHIDENDDKPSSIIVKHATDYTSKVPHGSVDPNRLIKLYEDRAMKCIRGFEIGLEGCVIIPKVLHYDDAAHVLAMEDAGSLPSLKGWFKPEVCSGIVCAQIGHELGKFLALLHNRTRGEKSILDMFEGNKSAREFSASIFFGSLPKAAAEFGYTDAFIAEVAEAGRRDVMELSEVLTHGDFWTSNVMVASPSSSDGPRLILLDFELAKPGYAANDIGQMAAEMLFLAIFRDRRLGLQLLESFLRAYRKYSEAPIAVEKVAIRAAAHLLFIAPIAWTDEGGEVEMQETGRIAFDLLRAGWEKDHAVLKQSIVGGLM